MPINVMFKNTKKAIVALVISPWLAIPTMTMIDLLFILARRGSYTATDIGGIKLFLMNLLLNSIVFSPVSYLFTFLLFLPAIYLLHIKNSITLYSSILIGATIGFITPSLIKSIYLLHQSSSEYEDAFGYILPNLSNIENAEPYIISTISGVIVVLGIWYIEGLTNHPNRRLKRHLC